MGYFLGQKMPDYNPFWEEPAYADQPDWWKWYHFGHEEGYAVGNAFYENRERLFEENEALRNLLDTRARLDKQLPDEEQAFIKEFMNKYDPQDKAPE